LVIVPKMTYTIKKCIQCGCEFVARGPFGIARLRKCGLCNGKVIYTHNDRRGYIYVPKITMVK